MKVYQRMYAWVAVCIVICGALSEPLIAIAYSYLGKVFETQEIDVMLQVLLPCVCIALLGIVLGYISEVLKVKISNKILYQLRLDVLEHIFQKRIPNFRKKSVGEFLNTLTKQCDMWQSMFYYHYLSMFKNMLQIFIMAGLLTVIHRSMFVLIFIFLLPLVVNNIIFPHKIQKEYEKYLKKDQKFLTFLKDCFSGYESMKVTLSEAVFFHRAKKIMEQMKHFKYHSELLGEFSGLIANCGVTLSQFAGTAFGVYLVYHQEISFSQFLMIFQFSTRLYEPFVGLINNVMHMKAAKPVINNLKNYLYGEVEDCLYQRLESIKSITLDGISFQYQFPVFHNVSYTFEKGTYLIIGESGSGKSTLVDMLMKNIEPTHGHIMYNQDCLENISTQQLYEKIGYMNQDSYVFQMSLKDNIDLHNMYQEEELKELMHAYHMEKIMDGRKDGLYDVLEEGKNRVSGGERARIVYLRTILGLRKDVYIFDEVLSSLDKENASIIEEAILQMKDKIILHIAHHPNPKFYDTYDHIIKIKNRGFHIIK